ncbi:MAG: phage baseplate protein, partial [Chloroflexota bacterium]
MRLLVAPVLLDVWERGLTRSPIQRALLLLAAAWPELEPDQPAALSIGQRDTLLLALREQLFGP